MHKVLLISNPRAGSVSPRTRDVIVRALSSEFKLEVADTAARDHAVELANDAVDRDFDAVFAFGGDGTINEAAQALVCTQVPLGIIPGGSTNVLARALGVPRDPVEATSFVASHLRSGTKRTINVGRANGRYFLFCFGMGLDAEVVKRVEADAAQGRTKTEWRFVKHAFAAGATEYRTTDAPLSIEVDGHEPTKGVIAIACNGRPFTYFKAFPVDVCPEARLDKGLDLFVLRNVRLTTIPRIIWGVFVSRSHTRWRKSSYFHDVSDIRLRADDLRPLQVDGDYIGEGDSVTLSVLRDALVLLV
jgi:diacylglycerol kinase family enzyme